MKTATAPCARSFGWGLALLSLLVFRTVYGLCAEFWFPDEKQVYLLGLKYFTTGLWPYFGPDVVYTQSQIPGALQALLVAAPFFVCPLPESPIVFLNFLSFGALAFLAWYISRRFPDVPVWWVWIWVLSCPWAMIYTTRVINLSYMLAFSVLFFVSLWEAVPLYREKVVPKPLCFTLMGLSFAAVMQLHMSWVLMVPLVGAAFFCQFREERRKLPVLSICFLAGFLAGVSTLVPTVVAHGLGGSGGIEQNIRLNVSHLKDMALIVPRFLYFAALQIHYMLPASWASLFRDHLWLFPVAATLEVIGWLQILLFAGVFFLPQTAPEWNRVRWLTGGTLGLVSFSFLFSVKEPTSHTFYVLFPLAILYSFYGYRKLMLLGPWVKRFMAFVLLAGFVFHGGLALDGLAHRSLYRDRPLVVQAIEKKDYTIMGLRRADDWGHGY